MEVALKIKEKNNCHAKGGFRLWLCYSFFSKMFLSCNIDSAVPRLIILYIGFRASQKAVSQEFPDLPLLQIRKMKQFRQQPSLSLPSNSSKRWVPILGLSRPLNPVILTPCSWRQDIPDPCGLLETHLSQLSFLPCLHPPSLRRSFVCF